MHREPEPFPQYLAALLAHWGSCLDAPFATPLVPGDKYWDALAIAYGLFRHIPHNHEQVVLVTAANGLSIGRETQNP